MAFLIRSHSDPNKSSWIQLPGKVKGRFNSYAEADAYLQHCRGTSESENDKILMNAQVKIQKQKVSEKQKRNDSTAESKKACILVAYILWVCCVIGRFICCR